VAIPKGCIPLTCRQPYWAVLECGKRRDLLFQLDELCKGVHVGVRTVFFPLHVRGVPVDSPLQKSCPLRAFAMPIPRLVRSCRFVGRVAYR